jgi:hypothetical protein
VSVHALTLSATLACLLVGTNAEAEDKPPAAEFEQTLRSTLRSLLTKRMSKKEERNFFKLVAHRIVDAAHPSHRGVDLESYQLEHEPGLSGAFVVALNVTYFGRFTTTGYPAEIRITLEPDKPGWFVSKLVFLDKRNGIASNQRNLSTFKERINQILEE